MLDRTMGIIILVVSLVHFLYMFVGHKQGFMKIVDIIGMLFGAALWQFPEKVNEILGLAEKTAGK